MTKIWKDHCGVFGVFLAEDQNSPFLNQLIINGMKALQHRGQDSAGISIIDHESQEIRYKKQPLLVDEDILTLEANGKFSHGLGHVRYATSTLEDNSFRDIQPFVSKNNFCFAHNGHFQNLDSTKNLLSKEHLGVLPLNDTAIVFRLLELFFAQNNGLDIKSIKSAFSMVGGAFSCIIATKTSMFAIRDKLGIRPLSLGVLNNHLIVSSESYALGEVGAKTIREVYPGEIIEFHKDNPTKSLVMTSEYLESKNKVGKSHCIFEHIYFANSKSVISKIRVGDFRKQSGIQLAEQLLAEKRVNLSTIDIVVPVPAGGIEAGVTFAQTLGLKLEHLLVKKLKLRSFIIRSETKKLEVLKEKFEFLHEQLKNKNIILVDDSIVRGSTMRVLIAQLKKLGVHQIHIAISAPEIRFPCYYGIDTPDSENLIAAQKNTKELEEYFNVDSLTFLNEKELSNSVTMASKSENVTIGDFCRACITSDYPTLK